MRTGHHRGKGAPPHPRCVDSVRPDLQPGTAPALQEVMLIGNNWEGVADVIKSCGDFAKIGRINLIPDEE